MHTNRDLTDSQWSVLDPLIPEPLVEKMAAAARGGVAVLFLTGYSGCCGLVPHGPIYLTATRRTKPATDAFSK